MAPKETPTEEVKATSQGEPSSTPESSSTPPPADSKDEAKQDAKPEAQVELAEEDSVTKEAAKTEAPKMKEAKPEAMNESADNEGAETAEAEKAEKADETEKAEKEKPEKLEGDENAENLETSKTSPKEDAAAEEGDAEGATKEAESGGSAKKEEGDAASNGDGNDEEHMDDEEEEEPEKQTEQELDAEPDERARVSEPIALNEYDATLDVMCASSTGLVSSLSQGGFQYLLSGVRANTGVKAGRYAFEVKVLEKAQGLESTLRIGVSASKSSLLLGDGSTSCAFFNDEGSYCAPTVDNDKVPSLRSSSSRTGLKIFGVVVNLDPKSANPNTMSLFLDGVRTGEPKPLPEHLVGQALYPTVSFKNMTLAVNLGAGGTVLKKLPFRCRMFADIAADDAEVSPLVRSSSSGGKFSVVVPVGLPEEGFFEHVDRFLERNPEYVELSDRKLFDWCSKSGLKQQQFMKGWHTNDRPAFAFGIASVDNKSVKPMLRTLSQLTRRNYIIAECKANLVNKEREEVVRRFAGPQYKLVASVAVGEPSAEHKEWVHKQIMAEYNVKKEKFLAHKRVLDERRKMAEERKRVHDERKKKLKALADKREGKVKEEEEEEQQEEEEEEEEKKEETKDEKMEDTEVKKEEGEADVKKEEEEAAETPTKKQKVSAEAAEADDGAPPEPKLGPDVWHLPAGSVLDVAEKFVGQAYATFTLPAKEEGFDEIDYCWQPAKEAEEHLKQWIAEKKWTIVIEDLKPGEWFKEKYKAWQKTKKIMREKIQEATRKQKLAKEKERKEEVSKEASKEDGDADKDKEEEEEEEEEEAGEAEEGGERKAKRAKKETKEGADDGTKEKDKQDNSGDAAPKAEEEEPLEALHRPVEGGFPIYAGFLHEDRVLLQTRYELHLLVHAFLQDVQDSEYAGIPEGHLQHYFNLYFQSSWAPRNLGCQSFDAALEMLKDTLKLTGNGKVRFLTSNFDKDADVLTFVKFVEDERQDRVRRIEAGDESARLKIPKSLPVVYAADGKQAKGKGKTKSKADRKGTGKGKKGDKEEDYNGSDQRRSLAQRTWGRRPPGTSSDRGATSGDGESRSSTYPRPWDREGGKPAQRQDGETRGFKRPLPATRPVSNFRPPVPPPVRRASDSGGKGSSSRHDDAPIRRQSGYTSSPSAPPSVPRPLRAASDSGSSRSGFGSAPNSRYSSQKGDGRSTRAALPPPPTRGGPPSRDSGKAPPSRSSYDGANSYRQGSGRSSYESGSGYRDSSRDSGYSSSKGGGYSSSKGQGGSTRPTGGSSYSGKGGDSSSRYSSRETWDRTYSSSKGSGSSKGGSSRGYDRDRDRRAY